MPSNASEDPQTTTMAPTEVPFPLAEQLELFLVDQNWNSSVTHDYARLLLSYRGLITSTVPSLLSLGSIPLSVYIIYRILTRKTALNNYQIGVVLQCILGIVMAGINFFYVWYLLFTTNPWKTKITVVYGFIYNTSFMTITVFSVHWKNQFSKKIWQLAVSFVVLWILDILQTVALYVRRVDFNLYRKAVLLMGPQANNLEYYFSSLFFLFSVVVNVGCLIFLKRVDLTTFTSPGVLNGIKRMTNGLMFKLTLSTISSLINFEISRAVWSSNREVAFSPERHFLYPLQELLRYVYPVVDAVLTRYCVSGLLKKATPESSAPRSIKSDSVVSANFRQQNAVRAW